MLSKTIAGRVFERSFISSVNVDNSNFQCASLTVINWPSLFTSSSHVRKSAISVFRFRLSCLSKRLQSFQPFHRYAPFHPPPSSSPATRGRKEVGLKPLEQLERHGTQFFGGTGTAGTDIDLNETSGSSR